ncbi:UDP-N-acetylglucosamine:LPS N-acetylglucosamine transferase [Nocardioides exalbidus]|uniref:UDP-N-acetylglucosamine:LPS N-acetylglucosamine transferase n=1 Tax=Nocardioides exalbidus TaxID=402596 RepID=A0A1H4WD87_9ACTN|nr:glycosyltransferase [Nocardioides exalbidus]SEC91243.1 UDP-N-acetylglucosamine:LPS N-acetylglucosamine transferase [Nocardioides exalbidus]
MIGYYVHHVGTGHLNRARAVAAHLPVTGLSSLPVPDDWPGDWAVLDRDDRGDVATDETAGGALHWAPLGDDGLRSRMAAISSWISRARPAALVSDVSAEVALLARLHGVPVVSVVMPGDRGDRAHRAGYAASSALVAAWPPEADGMVRGLTPTDRGRLHQVGGMSRVPLGLQGPLPLPGADGRRSALLVSGRGGGHPSREQVERIVADSPGWSWRVLGGSGEWSDDPGAAMRDADVVVLQAGQGAIADVASARRPAVVVPARRPFDEQVATGAVLEGESWPCRVLSRLPVTGWSELLDDAASLDGRLWHLWSDGRAADRFVAVVEGVALARRTS